MRQIKINVNPQEDRLDKFLSLRVKTLTRSQAKKLIKQGLILVNGQEIDPDYEVTKSDVITIEKPPPKPIEVKPEKIPLKIIFEDDSILVIDKEEGVVVHPTMDHPQGTIVNGVLYHLKKAPGLGENLRPGIVHRLDKGTSGVLLVAKTSEALENLKQQFKDRLVLKKYIALVSRKVEPPVGTIEKPIDRHPVYRKKFTVSSSGKGATTNYRVVDTISSKYSLVEVEPKTGRTHQIRVHFSSIGHPIVGDNLYKGKGAPRLFLHANFLEFTHPKTGRRVSFRSELPSKLRAILDKIKKDSIKAK
jgi:23S rRNA pseudouridine1911/1915/1917 synthase